MPSFVFDLNDIELRILRDGIPVAESTGFAFIQGANVEFGDAARRRARLHPRQASNQYWHRLALDPLQIRGPNLANLADLVYRQLRELTTQAGMTRNDSLLVAAPGAVTPDQLGLLLGVAQELGITVNGLVDAAVVAATQIDRSGRVTHIDVSLHRATVTSLELGDTVVRLAVAEVPDAGLSHVIDGWVNVVANRFVAETRFDPLRIAETEQQVYNQVQDWLVSTDRGSELIAEANHLDALRRVTVPTALMIDKAIARLRPLSDAIPAHSIVLLSHRAAAVPGLVDRVRADHATIDTLPRDALARGVEANVDAIRSNPEALKFVTRLARDATSIIATKPTATPPPPSPSREPEVASRDGAATTASEPRWPTHVLYRGRARAIGARLNVGRAAFPESTRADALPERVALVERAADGVWARPAEPGVALNGKPLKEATRLRIGDALRLGDHEFVLIRVLDGEAS